MSECRAPRGTHLMMSVPQVQAEGLYPTLGAGRRPVPAYPCTLGIDRRPVPILSSPLNSILKVHGYASLQVWVLTGVDANSLSQPPN